MFYTNPKSCYTQPPKIQSDSNRLQTNAQVIRGETRSTLTVSTVSSGISIRSLRPKRVKTGNSVYHSISAALSTSNYEDSRPTISAFPSARVPKKKKREGITIYNVYNNENVTDGNELVVEPTQNDPPPIPISPSQPTSPRCLVTDEERKTYLKDKTGILPHWHEVEAESRQNNRQPKLGYDNDAAAKAWNNFFSTNSDKKKQHMKARKIANVQETVERPGRKERRESPPIDEVDVDPDYPKIKTSSEHVCRPFYGTCEAEKSSNNAIFQLVKAQKELKRLQFVTGSVLPQTAEYMNQIESIHNGLKMFNTQFRELQKETNNRLGERVMGQNFTFNVKQLPAMETPFPPGGLTDEQQLNYK